MDSPIQLPSIRLLESPTVHAVYHGGEMDGKPKSPFSGTLLGEVFVNGLAHVDESHVWPCVDPDRATPRTEGQRTWHLLVEEFGCRDITPESQPPRFPLRGPDPYHRKPAPELSEAELEALTAPVATTASSRGR